MIKHIRKLPQTSLNKAEGSALARYRGRVVGKTGLLGWLRYELAVTLFTSVGGALGLFGGGGLFAGVAGAIKAASPKTRVVAVEPAGCPSLHAAIEALLPPT